MKLNDRATGAPAQAGPPGTLEERLAALKEFVDVAPFTSFVDGGHAQLLDDAYQEYCIRCQDHSVDAEAFCDEYADIKSSLGRLIGAHHLMEQDQALMLKSCQVRWPEPGELFLGFCIVGELGRGGFARVYLATDPSLSNRQVALKVGLHGKAEANTLAKINHPNIVTVYSVSRDDDRQLTAVCMPYLGSATLCNLLDRVNLEMPAEGAVILEAARDLLQPAAALGSPQPASALHSASYVEGIFLIGAQLADALQFIHDKEIYHRDLKPSNVLLTPAGRPMLLDFNLSADGQTPETHMGGTIPYMPPEQLRAVGASKDSQSALLDARSDLFSLGVMLYELLTGTHPFGPLPIKAVLEEIRPTLLARQQQGPIPIRQLNANVPVKLARQVERCLAYDPKDRPLQASELASDFKAARSPWQQARRAIRRHPWRVATAASLVLAVACMGAAVRSQQEPEQARHWRLGQLAGKDQDYEAAVQHYSELLNADPRQRDVLLARARAYVKLGEKDQAYFNKAYTDFHSAEMIQPSGEISAAKGYCLLRSQVLFRIAGQYFEDAIQKGFATAAVHNNLAYCHFLGGNFDQAEKHLQTALSLEPQLQAAYFNRAALNARQVVVAAGGVDEPNVPGRPNAEKLATTKKCRDWIEQAKDDMRLALPKGNLAPLEWNFQAARVWTIAAVYFPGDRQAALEFLEKAGQQGLDPKCLILDRTFAGLTGSQDYDKIINAPGPFRALRTTFCIVDPLPDEPR